MAKIRIETTQNVIFELEASQGGERLVAGIIDLIAKLLYLWISSIVLSSMSISSEGYGIQWLYVFIVLVPIWIYEPVLEYFTDGRTLGKKVLKIKVLKTDGSKPSIGDVVLRWLLHPLTIAMLAAMLISEFLPGNSDVAFLAVFGGFFGWIVLELIFMGVNKGGQRVGDLASNTCVVKVKQRASLDDTILLKVDTSRYQVKYDGVLRFSDRDMRTIKEALEIYDKNNDPKHIRVLAIKAKEILGVEKKVRPRQFLKDIITDYNYLALENEEH